jgi:hypothetical protein
VGVALGWIATIVRIMRGDDEKNRYGETIEDVAQRIIEERLRGMVEVKR